MKKTIAVLTATLILMLSVFSMNAFASEVTKTDALFDKIEETKEVAVTFRTGRSKTFGDSYSAINTVYLKGDSVAYDFDNGFIELRTVVQGDMLVSFLPSFPFIHMKAEELSFGDFDLWGVINGTSDFTMEFLVFVKAYETTIDGVTYYVEEFSDRGSVINSFYYVGDDLKILKAEDFFYQTVQYTYFDEMSLTVDDSVFEIPAVTFDLTAIFKWFISLFV